MTYMILQRNQPSLQLLPYAEVANKILTQKIDILTNVCQQIQIQWQYKYYQDQNAWQEEVNKKNEYIASLQNQIENQKLKLNGKEQQVRQLKEQSIHLEKQYEKEQKSLKSQINEYIEINKNLQHVNTDQKAQIYVLRYDLKQHKETITDLQKQIKEMKPIRQCMECKLHASSRALKRQYTPVSYRYHSVSHEHSMELSLVIVKKTSTDIMISDCDSHQKHKRSNHATVVSPCTDESPDKPNLFSLLCSNIHTIKRSTSVDTARSISRLHTTNFKKQFVIPMSKTDICEGVPINEQSMSI